MKRLLLDTNILIDLLARRVPFYDEAVGLFLLAETQSVQLSVSSISMVNIHYVLKRQLSEQKVRKVLTDLRLLVGVLPMNQKISDLALNSDFKDFEDAIQYHTALEFAQEVIITRNLQDFKQSSIPVMTAGQFVHSLPQ